MTLPALLVAVALSQNVNWSVGARLDLRARTAYEGLDSNSVAAGDVGVGLDGQLGLSFGGWNLSIAYDPTFRLREPYAVQNGVHYDYTHRATASADWRREGSPHPYIRYSFNSGILDLSTLQTPTGATVPTNPIHGANIINTFGSDLTAGIDWPLSPLTTLTTEGGYFWGGGSDFLSAVTLPVQASPRGSVRLNTQLSPTDHLQVSLDGRYSLFGIWFGPYDGFLLQRVAMLNLQAMWTHQLDASTSFDLNAGGGLAGGDVPTSTHGVGNITPPQPLGTGGAGVTHQLHFGHDTLLDLRAQASVGPFIDPYLGTAYERVEGSFGLGLASGPHFLAWSRTGYGRSLLGGAYDVRSTYEDAGVGWQGAPWWRVDLSGRLAYFYQGSGPVAPNVASGVLLTGGAPLHQYSWVIGLSLTLTQRSE
ncbi:MAG: hypothetical protein QM723_16445 [Myxococcaceae bacterium]